MNSALYLPTDARNVKKTQSY